MSERAGLKFVGTQSEEAFDRVTKHPDLWHSRRGLTLVLHHRISVVRRVTMPLGFDQPGNTTRLKRLGVARWVRPNVFRGERLAVELASLLDDSRVAERCGHGRRKYVAAIRSQRRVQCWRR